MYSTVYNTFLPIIVIMKCRLDVGYLIDWPLSVCHCLHRGFIGAFSSKSLFICSPFPYMIPRRSEYMCVFCIIHHARHKHINSLYLPFPDGHFHCFVFHQNVAWPPEIPCVDVSCWSITPPRYYAINTKIEISKEVITMCLEGVLQELCATFLV